LYLAAVIDLFNRQVVGWGMQAYMPISLVKDALAMAWFRRRPDPGLIFFHSDRGRQYCGCEFQDGLRIGEIYSSMRRKGRRRGNVPIERF
jgi:putative transposase